MLRSSQNHSPSLHYCPSIPLELMPLSDAWKLPWSKIFRSGKLQNESLPNFSIFRPELCPEFCPEFSPNFSRTFRASFRGRRRTEKIHQKSPPFFKAKFPGKHERNIHKILLESRQGKNFGVLWIPVSRSLRRILRSCELRMCELGPGPAKKLRLGSPD